MPLRVSATTGEIKGIFFIMEVWKDIYGYEGSYQISNHGRVKSLKRKVNNGWGKNRIVKEKILKNKITTHGYCSIKLGGKSKDIFVHRLVALHFIPNPENKPFINHIDGNKQNNYYSNLEWCTASENQKHAHEIGLKKSPKGKESHMYGKTGKEAHNTKKVICTSTGKTYESILEASKDLNIKYSTLRAQLKGQNKNKTTLKILL